MALFITFWIVSESVGSGQCGNADTVVCTPFGWVLLYGWMALGLLVAGLVLLALVLGVTAAVSARRGRAGPGR